MRRTDAILYTPAAELPVSLVEAKEHLRVTHANEDADITLKLSAACADIENATNRALVSSVWEIYLDAWPCAGAIVLPKGNLVSVANVKYYGTDDTPYTLSPSVYGVDVKSDPGRIALKYGQSWPSVTLRPYNGVEIRFTAGWANAAAVPYPLKAAILLQLAHLYQNREAVIVDRTASVDSKELARGVDSLIAPYRLWSF